MVDAIRIHCFISGKVQGVWFRAFVKEQADKLGISGFARNLPDGRVEVMAAGDRERLSIFQECLKKGPELAKVTDVACEELTWQAYQGFEVK